MTASTTRLVLTLAVRFHWVETQPQPQPRALAILQALLVAPLLGRIHQILRIKPILAPTAILVDPVTWVPLV